MTRQLNKSLLFFKNCVLSNCHLTFYMADTEATTINEQWDKLVSLVETGGTDASKFYQKGNKTAGTRLRKVLLDLKNMAHDIRKDI